MTCAVRCPKCNLERQVHRTVVSRIKHGRMSGLCHPCSLNAHRRPNVADRFLALVEEQDGCWPWLGHKDVEGYGRITVNGKRLGAARLSYERFVGPIPKGLHVLHSCDNPGCVNPDHLRIGTHADNMRDIRERRRNPGARRTHCKHGHEFTEANTYRRLDGTRDCRACVRERARRYIQRKRDASSPATPPPT